MAHMEGSNPLAPTNKNGRKSHEKALRLEGLFHLVRPSSGDTGPSGASWILSCHFGCHLQL